MDQYLCSRSDSFTVSSSLTLSARLLIADPFDMGYTDQRISELMRQARKNQRVSYLQNGAFWSTGGDGVWAMISCDDQYALIQNANITPDDIEGARQMLDAKEEFSFSLSVGTDSATIFIGDAERYMLPKSQWETDPRKEGIIVRERTVLNGETLDKRIAQLEAESPHVRKEHQKVIEDTYNQITFIHGGRYRCESKDDMLCIKPYTC